MSKAIINSALRVSDYLDKQAIKEKEKKKEKILSILPSFIEQQVSGISDKETLYKTIPKLSAELYTYGADVGNAANQILGNIAQTKFREIAEIEEKKGLKDQIGIMEQIGKNLEFEGGKTSTDFLNEMIGKGYDEKTIALMYGNVLESQKIKKTGIGTIDDKGKPIFISSKYGPNGNWISSETIMFNQTKEGVFADKISTAIKETDPLPQGAIEFYSEQKLKNYEKEQNAKLQLGNSMALARYQMDLQLEKMKEMDLNKVRALRYYDMGTNEQVKVDKDKNGTPYFYTEKDEEIEVFGSGGKLQKVKTGNKVRVPYTKGFDKLQEIGQQPQDNSITNADIDQAWQNANRILGMLGEKLIEKGENREDYVGPNGFFLRDKVLKEARNSDDPEIKKLLDAYTIKEKEAYNEIVGTTSIEIPSIFRKK